LNAQETAIAPKTGDFDALGVESWFPEAIFQFPAKMFSSRVENGVRRSVRDGNRAFQGHRTGPFRGDTDKRPAPWSLAEGSVEAGDYLSKLERLAKEGPIQRPFLISVFTRGQAPPVPRVNFRNLLHIDSRRLGLYNGRECKVRK
jgi:hypothetical protein